MSQLQTKMRAYSRSLLLAVLLVAWLLGSIAGLAALSASLRLGPLAIQLLMLAIGVPAAVGGLVLYWSVADEVAFRRRGYRIRYVARDSGSRWAPGSTTYAYEELAPDGSHRALHFVRVILETGYPCKSEVLVPEEEAWDARTPSWARGRRSEIVERVLDAAGPVVTRIGRAA